MSKSHISRKTNMMSNVEKTAALCAAEQVEANKFLGRVISVTSGKKESGKSTVATALAGYLGSETIKDGDIERPLTAVLFDISGRFDQLNTEHSNNGDYSSWDYHSMNMFAEDGSSEESFKRNLEILKEKYDFIIINTPVAGRQQPLSEVSKNSPYFTPRNSLLEATVYPASDQIIYVAGNSAVSVLAYFRWIRDFVGNPDKGITGMNPEKVKAVFVRNLQPTDDEKQNAPQPIDFNSTQRRWRKGTHLENADETMGIQSIAEIPHISELWGATTNHVKIEQVFQQPKLAKVVGKIAESILPTGDFGFENSLSL